MGGVQVKEIVIAYPPPPSVLMGAHHGPGWHGSKLQPLSSPTHQHPQIVATSSNCGNNQYEQMALQGVFFLADPQQQRWPNVDEKLWQRVTVLWRPWKFDFFCKPCSNARCRTGNWSVMRMLKSMVMDNWEADCWWILFENWERFDELLQVKI